MEPALTTRSAILHALVLPACGVDLIDRIRRGSQGRMRPGPGSVYPALARLEREGLVHSRLDRGLRKVGRPRRYYALTGAGIRAASVERALLASLLRLGSPPPVDVRRMVVRVERTAAISRAVARLRQRDQTVP